MKKKHTDIRPKVRRSLHLDSQIAIHLADDLYRMSNGEMRVLHITPSLAQKYPLIFPFFPSLRNRGQLRTRFKMTSTFPPASMMAVSPRSWTTLTSMRTMRCWKFERWGARMRGV
jgi:hypothetical protein